ncbi:carbohydrate ABC transporter permease [Thermus tenuipuniceus]|uniref:carbohydrate ABC transporter permease n=1 Tax=Thermus tenuipuniceus TaxID=2078690 RepID=UPI0013E34355|nr:sugar ABC transporter permease [Thermus tenuipuniceus]
MGKGLVGFLLAGPSTSVVLAFALLPMGFSAYLSLTSWSGLGGAEWVGLENYRQLLQDPRFARYLWQTLTYALFAVPLGVVFPLLVALAIHNLKGFWAGVFRVLFYLPLVTGVVATALLAQALVGLFPQNPFARPESVLPALAAFSVWQGMGSAILLYLAGLSRLPRELYEAAAVDGAGPWASFWHVTLPGILPVASLVLVLSTIASLQVFEAVLFLTRGGPGDASTTLALYIYTTAFRYFRMGQATAMAWVVAAGLFLLVLVQRRLERRLADAEA